MERFIELGNLRVRVVRKRGQKRMCLKLDRHTGEPIVSIPYLCPMFVATRFVAVHQVWLEKNKELHPTGRKFEDKMRFDFLGQSLIICHTPDKHAGVYIQNGTLYVCGQAPYLHRRVRDFLKKEVLLYIQNKVLPMNLEKVKRITVKDTVSRWGSCASSGNLSFCWRLGLAPLYVLDYVIAHEVAHLDEMNHSVFFWRRVAQLDKNVRQAQKWLAENAAYLHSFD